MRRAFNVFVLAATVLSVATTALAELPAAETALADLDFSAAQIADIKAGKIVTADAKPAHERDLAATFAFMVPVPPAELVKVLKAGLLAHVDSNIIALGTISAAGSPEDFAKLSVSTDGDKRLKRYASAKPGTDLNLSADEIAAFDKLGSAA